MEILKKVKSLVLYTRHCTANYSVDLRPNDKDEINKKKKKEAAFSQILNRTIIHIYNGLVLRKTRTLAPLFRLVSRSKDDQEGDISCIHCKLCYVYYIYTNEFQLFNMHKQTSMSNLSNITKTIYKKFTLNILV